MSPTGQINFFPLCPSFDTNLYFVLLSGPKYINHFLSFIIQYCFSYCIRMRLLVLTPAPSPCIEDSFSFLSRSWWSSYARIEGPGVLTRLGPHGAWCHCLGPDHCPGGRAPPAMSSARSEASFTGHWSHPPGLWWVTSQPSDGLKETERASLVISMSWRCSSFTTF